MSDSQYPFWSVVVPLYNKAPYIEATLRSVLVQTDPDFELIVVDDGSLDEGAAIVEAIADARIRLVRQRNAGVSAARNRGIAESRGQFVAFLDGDDLYHPECLARLRALHAQYPTAGMLGGRYDRVPHEQMGQHRFKPLPVDAPAALITNLPAEFLRRALPFSASSVAVARWQLLAMPTLFPIGESMGEDLDLWFRIAEATPVATTGACVSVYRIGIADSLMGTTKLSELAPFLVRMEMRAKNGQIALPIRSASLSLAAFAKITLARQRLKDGSRKECLRILMNSWRGASTKRWWFTLFGALAVPTGLVGRILTMRD